MSGRTHALFLAVALCACSSAGDTGSELQTAGTPAAGSGSTLVAGGGGQGVHGDAGPCTPLGTPDDEFFVACPDAGTQLGGPDAATPDAAQTLPELDAGPTLDSAMPPAGEPDEGHCAAREASCGSGRGITTTGSAVCTIALNALRVERQVCEVCGQNAVLGDLALSVRDCGGCTQVFREGGGVEFPIGANACTQQSRTIGLAWTAADPSCVDVYAYVGSSEPMAAGWVLSAADEIRVCRCNRMTDTCVSCDNGACDAPP